MSSTESVVRENTNLSGRQKGAQNRDRLRIWLEEQAGAELPVKLDGSVNLAAVAAAAGLEAQVLTANAGCRELVANYAAAGGQAMAPVPVADLDDRAIAGLAAFSVEARAGKHEVVCDGVLNLTIVADLCGIDPDLLFRSNRARRLLLDLAEVLNAELPRFATASELAGRGKDARKMRDANQDRQQVALLEAQVFRLAKELTEAREEIATLKARLELDLGGVGL